MKRSRGRIGDRNIRKWRTQGKEFDEIADLLENGTGIYPHDEIKKEFWAFCDKVKEREKQWDIKILDFILEHYKIEKLFYEPYHLTVFLTKEIVRRTLKYLNFKGEIEDSTLVLQNLDELFIYSDVKWALEMTYEEHSIRNNGAIGRLSDRIMDYREYVRQELEYLTFEEVDNS